MEPRSLAIAATAGFVVIAAFQAMLALGAPFGRAAWGGTRTHLPTNLRVASGVAVLVWSVAALVVLDRAGYDLLPISNGVARWGTWILVGLLAIGAAMNLASSSPWERFLWAPLALLVAVFCFLIARS